MVNSFLFPLPLVGEGARRAGEGGWPERPGCNPHPAATLPPSPAIGRRGGHYVITRRTS